MCGIAGYFNPDQNYAENPKQNFHTLSRMINTMNHRGPDTYGHTIINSCCLAHTRLSIIDLENGRQPMSYTKDGNTYYIVYKRPEQILPDGPDCQTGQPEGFRNFCQIGGDDSHFGYVHGDVTTSAHSDTQVGLGKGGAVVDAIAHHRHFPSFCL